MTDLARQVRTALAEPGDGAIEAMTIDLAEAVLRVDGEIDKLMNLAKTTADCGDYEISAAFTAGAAAIQEALDQTSAKQNAVAGQAPSRAETIAHFRDRAKTANTRGDRKAFEHAVSTLADLGYDTDFGLEIER